MYVGYLNGQIPDIRKFKKRTVRMSRLLIGDSTKEKIIILPGYSAKPVSGANLIYFKSLTPSAYTRSYVV